MMDIGSDHCRVRPADAFPRGFERFEFLRHLHAYHEAARRIVANARVLEVGCGEGYGAEYLRSTGKHVCAVDLSAEALGHVHAAYPDVRVCRAVATNLPFRDASFSAAVSFQVVEHVRDVALFAAELRRVLVPGGLLFLTTPNRRLRLRPFQKPWNEYHVREYSRRQLHRCLSRVFDSVQVHGIAAAARLMAAEKARVKPPVWRVLGRKIRILGDPVDVWGNTQAEHSDFFLTDYADAALDLFAVAKRL